jgi:hypothetical protein
MYFIEDRGAGMGRGAGVACVGVACVDHRCRRGGGWVDAARMGCQVLDFTMRGICVNGRVTEGPKTGGPPARKPAEMQGVAGVRIIADRGVRDCVRNPPDPPNGRARSREARRPPPLVRCARRKQCFCTHAVTQRPENKGSPGCLSECQQCLSSFCRGAHDFLSR